MLVTVPHVSRSCEPFPDGFDLQLYVFDTKQMLSEYARVQIAFHRNMVQVFKGS